MSWVIKSPNILNLYIKLPTILDFKSAIHLYLNNKKHPNPFKYRKLQILWKDLLPSILIYLYHYKIFTGGLDFSVFCAFKNMNEAWQKVFLFVESFQIHVSKKKKK